MNLPVAIPFLLWVFDCYCDSDSGNYGHANRQAEYGVSKADFVQDNESGAVEDAIAYLSKVSVEWRKGYVIDWQKRCRALAARYTQMADLPIEVDTL